MEVVEAVNTLEPLKLVLEPMLSISFLILLNSLSSAVCWVAVTVPLLASVARVTARLSRLVTWERAPSATWSWPTPSLAFCEDWLSAVMLACMPLAMARPAASSAPLLMREPDDNWNRVDCNCAWVLDKAFCAASAGMLCRMLIDMGKTLLSTCGGLLPAPAGDPSTQAGYRRGWPRL